MTERVKMDLALSAEIEKLNAEIGLSEDSRAALALVDTSQVRSLRRLINQRRFQNDQNSFGILARLAALLPATFVANLSKTALGPLFSGHLVGQMHPVSAAKVAKNLPAEQLIEIARHAAPEKAREIIKLIPADIIKDAALQLVEKKDYLLMGRFADALSTPAIRLVVNAIEDDGMLLNVAHYMEEPSQLSKIVMMIDNDRIARIILTGTEKSLWPQTLFVIDNVNPELKGRLANIMAEQDEAILNDLVEVAHKQNLWAPVLRAMAQMHPKYHRKIVNLPALKDAEILGDLVLDAHEKGLLATALPLAKVMRPAFQKIVADAALDKGPEIAEAALWAAQNSGRWDVILDLAQHLGEEQRDMLAGLPIVQNTQVLTDLLHTGASCGKMGLLLDFAKRFDAVGLRKVVDIGLLDSGELLENIIDAATDIDGGWDAVVTAVACIDDDNTLKDVGSIYGRQTDDTKQAFRSAAANQGIWDRVAPFLEAA